MKKLHLAVLGLALCAASAQAADAPSGAPSIADFVRHPTYSSAKISPTGEYLALTVDMGEQDVLTVLRTKDLSLVKINQLPEKKSVGRFEWVSPERLMFTAHRKVGRYAAPMGDGQWYSVNADGSQPRTLVAHESGDSKKQRSKQIGNRSFQLLDTLQDDDANVIMAASSRRSIDGVGTELILMDATSGLQKPLARAPRENCELALDATKAPRFAICYDDEDAQGNFDSQNELYRRDDDGKWTLINSSKNSGKHLSVIGTSTDGLIYANQSDGKKPEALGTIDLATGAFKTLFEDPISDPAGYITSADGETILGVITEAGAPRVTMVDEKHPDAEIYASLAGAFPGQLVRFSSATKDGKKIVVSVVSDKNPGELYLYDRDTGKARFLMQGRKWLDPKKMASVKPFSMTTRDGLKIYGYLTIPHGSDGKNLPMIVNVHGGPMGPRDDWAFNWETQLLASRGYLVMQINYRGSGGFGKGFQDMGYGTWATGIMNDIIDATKWTINQGYADGDRVCIYGGSFGGYASLMAPTIDQKLFKCAFGYVGAYDIDVQLTKSDTSDRESGRRYMARAFGKTKAEQDAMSPVKHADKFKIPVYLAAGARDPRCPPENTESMNKALIAAGNPPEGMIIQSGEMHGFYKEENNQRLYTEMLGFFDRHIGGKVNVGGASKAN